jgi:S-adenosylmethionine:tRNA ribosyltransferase-isomerase
MGHEKQCGWSLVAAVGSASFWTEQRTEPVRTRLAQATGMQRNGNPGEIPQPSKLWDNLHQLNLPASILGTDLSDPQDTMNSIAPRADSIRADQPFPINFRTSDFDFQLPPELIAQHPAAERSASRLLDGRSAPPAHRIFRDLPTLLREGDLLVFNDTQVVKARLFGEKASGGKLELLIERVVSGLEVVAHMKVSKKPRLGDVVYLYGKPGETIQARLIGRWPDEDGALFRFELSHDPYWVMEQFGHVPLPPYVERHQSSVIEHADEQEDEQRYQTVFAKHPGAVAAPTAALHFDEALFAQLQAQGIERAFVTLHVGAGTFQPVKVENIADHTMHFERYSIPAETLETIQRCQARGGRIIAVGTTSVRSLETYAKTKASSGDTNIFITPGFEFQLVDMLITNFHLPKSTLMMLVSAFAGYEHIMKLYDTAVQEKYRFFSYGDSMLLQRAL